MSTADGYAKRFMGAGSAIVTSRAAVAPWANILQSIIFGSLVLGAIVFGGWPTPVFLAGALLLLAVWLTSMVVRTTLTETHLHVQHGFLGPRIAIDDVVEVRIEKVGIGHWLAAGRSAYLVAGVKQAVAIRYRDNGRVRSAVVGVHDPDALVAAFDRVRSVRVDLLLEAAEAAAEADELAEEERSNAGASRKGL